MQQHSRYVIFKARLKSNSGFAANDIFEMSTPPLFDIKSALSSSKLTKSLFRGDLVAPFWFHSWRFLGGCSMSVPPSAHCIFVAGGALQWISSGVEDCGWWFLCDDTMVATLTMVPLAKCSFLTVVRVETIGFRSKYAFESLLTR